MGYIAKNIAGEVDTTEYETVDAAIEAIAAMPHIIEVVRVEDRRDDYARVICKGQMGRGYTFSIVPAPRAQVAAPIVTRQKSAWAQHVDYCRIHHEGDTDMPSPYRNR